MSFGKRQLFKLAGEVATGCLLLASVSFANEPLPTANIQVRVEVKNRDTAEVIVKNMGREHLEIDLHEMHRRIGNLLPRPDMEVDAALPPPHVIPIIKPIHVVVPSMQEIRTPFKLQDANEDGVSVVHFQSHAKLPNGQEENGPIVYQVYKHTPNGIVPISFEEGFLSKRLAVLKPGQKFRPASLALGGGLTQEVGMAELAYNARALDAAHVPNIQPVKLGSPIEMADKLRLGQVPAVGGKQSMRGMSLFNQFSLDNEDQPTETAEISNVEGFALEREQDESMPVNALSSLTLKGHMSTKYNDGSFHGAWGWVVTAWQWSTFAGVPIYMPLGWTYVNGDGSWTIPLASFASQSSKVFVQYQTGNRFVQIQDPSSHVYTWGDWWSLSGAVTDIGYRYADLSSNGDLPGIDKLYEGATEIWTKFYNNGLNALRDKPIEVTYPNKLSSGHCIYNKDSSGNTVPAYAWSCSEWASGKIWIIPAHGDKSVVQHEVGHSINSYYWNGNLSSGAGGAHSLTGCYNGGLALTEGFANFLVYWVQFDRGATSPIASYFNRNIDTYDSDNCNPGENNEMRVASTFWDMYDNKNDGPGSNRYDGWYYIDQASPVALFLKNGTKQKMSDYLSIVDAGDSKWFEADRALFRLNHIIP